jgi:hypothetical protein
LLKIANKRDFLAGLMFVGIGVAALIVAKDLRMGTAVRMGAGFFPTILTGAMVLLGLFIMVTAVRSSEEAAPHLAWRPAVVIAGSVALFAALITAAGLALTTFLMVVASRLARPGHPWKETLLLAFGVTVVSAGVFYYGLGLQFPLWPQLG